MGTRKAPLEVVEVVALWLKSRERAKKISRNTIAVGIVVLDHLRRECPTRPDRLFSSGGELRGARSGLQETFRRYGIPPKLLKEATGRQAAPDARALAEALRYGQDLVPLDPTAREEQLQKGLALLIAKAHDWLNRQPIKVNCDRQQSPAFWIASILEKAKGRSGGVVEQHLVGAKLQRRHPEIAIPTTPDTLQTCKPVGLGTSRYQTLAITLRPRTARKLSAAVRKTLGLVSILSCSCPSVTL